MNFKPGPGHLHCQTFLAEPNDVDRAFTDLNRDMDPQFVHVFLDKLQRYAQKPDRDLFLANYSGKIIAFATIIDASPVPKDLPQDTVALLEHYACGTGLMVLPTFRNLGVASKLVISWHQWAIEKERAGVWIVTRKMADWYQRCFHYSLQGTTIRNQVKKIILAKPL